MSDIKEGKLKIICKDGLAQNTQIITPRGDLIYASKVVIEIKPPGLMHRNYHNKRCGRGNVFAARRGYYSRCLIYPKQSSRLK